MKAGATREEIANAEADLKEAQAKYDALVAPPTGGTLKEARSKLAAAQAKLAALKAGPTASKLSTAQLAVTTAQTALKTAQNDAALNKQKKQAALNKADRDLQQAQRDYARIASKVLDGQGNFNIDPNDRNYRHVLQRLLDRIQRHEGRRVT